MDICKETALIEDLLKLRQEDNSGSVLIHYANVDFFNRISGIKKSVAIYFDSYLDPPVVAEVKRVAFTHDIEDWTYVNANNTKVGFRFYLKD
jgi:hypothetical protein